MSETPYHMHLDECNPSAPGYEGPLIITFDRELATGYDNIESLFGKSFEGKV